MKTLVKKQVWGKLDIQNLLYSKKKKKKKYKNQKQQQQQQHKNLHLHDAPRILPKKQEWIGRMMMTSKKNKTFQKKKQKKKVKMEKKTRNEKRRTKLKI
jgi:hypothetical protein